MADQSQKLVETLAAVVTALGHIEQILPAVRALAIRHVGYGVGESHYELVGLALIETLRDMRGPSFDGELERAWRDAYKMVAAAMIEAARHSRQPA